MTTNADARRSRLRRWVPFALVALVLVPAVGGSVRLVELAGGPHSLPAKPHVTASPGPLVLHIVAALLYGTLGAFQFSPGILRRRRRWHRLTGRVLVGLGLLVAFSALWMTQITPRSSGAALLLHVFRLGVGSGMAVSIVLGCTTIRRGDVAGHRAWMTRAYALGLGAGTQVFTIGIGQAIFGADELTNTLMQGVAWAINLAIAERAIRRRPGRRPSQVLVGVSTA